ncbi:MAG: pyridoxamine 5'-phosphate oxidase family protein [Polyangiales bacterium]
MATLKTQSPKPTADEADRKFQEILRGFDNAMLVTHADNAQLHARPMAVAATDPDGSVWFITGADSTKTFEAAQRPEILAVMQGSSKYLSIMGSAEFSRDREHINRLWKEAYKVWFSQGKDDPNILLIRLRPDSAEYWDNSGAQGVKFALRAAKAYVTGNELRNDGGDDVKTHAKVQL